MKPPHILLIFLLSVILAVGIFIAYSYFQREKDFKTPIPDSGSVKIILTTPEPTAPEEE